MSTLNPRSWRPAVLLGLILLLLAGAGGGTAWLLARHGARGPLRVLLVTPPPARNAGLDASQARAVAALVQDYLEHYGGLAITSVSTVPTDLEPLRGQPNSLIVILEPVRRDVDLALSFRFVRGRRLLKDLPPPWVRQEAPFQKPAEAFATFLQRFPEPIPLRDRGLLPRSPKRFWDLVRAGAWRLTNEHLEEAANLAEEVTRMEPDSVSAWILLGNLRYRSLLNNSAAIRREQLDVEALLQRGLALAPGHPRGTFLLSLLMADGGNQADCLALLLQARRSQPHNPTLLTGIAYAARGAGLLKLASRAMDLRDKLAFTQLQPQAVDITCLYTGDIARFEASLQERPGHLRSTTGVLPFYRGYLALAQGDRPRARREFQAMALLDRSYPNLLRVSQIYLLILEGKTEEALRGLRVYDQERTGLREPDGEFTLRMAEAYAMLGDRASAMDMAGRAFARGFGCTEWYERSPMLEPLRGLPKWKALLQHLRERQSLMEERFPLDLLENP
jgi:hypothetical protein